MPKPLSPDQLQTLQANGVVVPGFEVVVNTPDTALPAGLVIRTLGSVGLPHAEIVDRMDSSGTEHTPTGSLETLNAPRLVESYRATYETVSQIMALVGESVPDMRSSELVSHLERLKPLFEAFTAHRLEPEIALKPSHRPLSFWVNLAKTIQDSSLNPAQASGSEKVLRNGGLWVAEEVKSEWNTLAYPADQAPGWKLEVISGLAKPKVVNVTSYGYIDRDNKQPSPELSELLRALNQPAVTDRTRVPLPPLIQPDIHPTPDGYLMHQLTRIIQGKAPLDSTTWSWLKGEMSSGRLPVGSWYPVGGQVRLYWDDTGSRVGALGVRPSGRGQNLEP